MNQQQQNYVYTYICMYKRNENNKQHENENIVKWAIRSTSESRECIIMIKHITV